MESLDTNQESHLEEVAVFAIISLVLLALKFYACFFSLGLCYKHKSLPNRRDSMSLAKLNSLKLVSFEPKKTA